MENALKKLSPSMSPLSEIQTLEIIEADLPSSPKLSAAWGSLSLRRSPSFQFPHLKLEKKINKGSTWKAAQL